MRKSYQQLLWSYVPAYEYPRKYVNQHHNNREITSMIQSFTWKWGQRALGKGRTLCRCNRRSSRQRRTRWRSSALRSGARWSWLSFKKARSPMSYNLAAGQLNSFILKLAANPESWLGECDLISFITFAVATECISKNIYGQRRSTSHRRRRRSRWEDLVRRIASTQQEQRLQNVYINFSSTSFSHFPSDRLAGASNNWNAINPPGRAAVQTAWYKFYLFTVIRNLQGCQEAANLTLARGYGEQMLERFRHGIEMNEYLLASTDHPRRPAHLDNLGTIHK